MLVIRSGLGDNEPPASIAYTPGPFREGYVMPAPGTIPPSSPAPKKRKAAASSRPASQVIANAPPDTSTIAERLKEIPMVVWILLGLGALAGVWWYTGKGRKGRRRRGGRPFARARGRRRG